MQERLPRSSARQAFSLFARGSVVTVVGHSALDFGDRFVRELQRGLAMSAFVAVGVLQLRASEALVDSKSGQRSPPNLRPLIY
jgi:hypothetical protein